MTRLLASVHTSTTLAARARPLFPALRREFEGRPVAYFDGPGGTQVPRSVADAMSEYLLQHNANDGWEFATSRETDVALTRARANVATFVNAASPGEILFGANMTTLAFHITRAVGRSLRPGDEIVVTELDHHANIDPWLALERDYGAVLKFVRCWRIAPSWTSPLTNVCSDRAPGSSPSGCRRTPSVRSIPSPK